MSDVIFNDESLAPMAAQTTSYTNDEYSANRVIISSRVSTFEKLIRDCGFPDEIVTKSLYIHKQMCDHVRAENESYIARHGPGVEKKLTYRGNNTQMLIFFCIMCAHYEFNLKPDPKEIAKRCGIRANQMTKAFGMCRESKTGYRPVNTTTDPLDLTSQYYYWLKLPIGNYHAVEKMVKDVLQKCPDLIEEHPGTVAGTILVVYCKDRGIKFDGVSPVEKITEVARCSSIKTMVGRIETIYNS